MITLQSFNVVGFPFHIRIGMSACLSSERPLHACMLWTIGDDMMPEEDEAQGRIVYKEWYTIVKLNGCVITCLLCIHIVGGLLACFAVSETASTMNFITAGADPGINYKGQVGVHRSMNIITKGETMHKRKHYVLKCMKEGCTCPLCPSLDPLLHWPLLNGNTHTHQ